jgi:hypothetical protein
MGGVWANLVKNKIWEDYFTLHCYSLSTGVIISSQPIESSRLEPARWNRLAEDLLLRIHGSPPKIDKIPIQIHCNEGKL